MKINDLNSNLTSLTTPTQIETSKASEASTRHTAGRTSSGPAQDHVDISNMASGISQALSTNAVQRTAKVTALAAAYQSGKYNVDAEAVSRKIVDAHLTPGNGR
jgi:flagellar biosynthesis anti-sigma factor FlgM